jgi:hypothetical protein
MKRVLVPVAVVVAVGVIFWLMVQNLQTEPVGRDDPAAIILRAPDGYVVDDLGSASLASAAGLLIQSSGAQVGKRFSEQGDTVILLADRGNDRVVEMRASRSGTIVERRWQGEVDRRLAWAVEHGDLNPPGLPGPTGKNLYH